MAPETASPTKLQTGSQLLTKDFLRFWMVYICRGGGEVGEEVAPRVQFPITNTRHT